MGEYAARTKYDLPGRARRYAQRNPKRDAAEWRLLERILAGLETPASALDVPSGTGRIAERLIDQGIATRTADLSPAMRAETQARLEGRAGFLGVTALDLEIPPPPGLQADLVVCFRFLHHLPDAAARGRVLGTLAALARRDLLVSFHHPVSFHNVSRTLRGVLRGRPSDRQTLGRRQLAREAEAAGLTWVGAHALSAWRRELWVAHLRKPGAEGQTP